MPAPGSPLVFVDRDGVINRDSDEYIKSVAEWQPLPGSLEAIAALTAAGRIVVVITNQSGIGRGLFSRATLAEIHAAMIAAVEAAGGRIAALYYCPHRPDDDCDCRKPKPAMILRAAAELGQPLEGSCLIGDKGSDVEAAIAAGIRPIIVGDRVAAGDYEGVARFADLRAAAAALLADAEGSAERRDGAAPSGGGA